MRRNAALRIDEGITYYESLLETTLAEVREARLEVQAYLDAG